jgi:hypothetical protein
MPSILAVVENLPEGSFSKHLETMLERYIGIFLYILDISGGVSCTCLYASAKGVSALKEERKP